MRDMGEARRRGSLQERRAAPKSIGRRPETKSAVRQRLRLEWATKFRECEERGHTLASMSVARLIGASFDPGIGDEFCITCANEDESRELEEGTSGT